jgi:hypothetical protein
MRPGLVLLIATFLAQNVLADTKTEQLGDIVVSGRSDDLSGVADSATEGTVGAQEIEERPIARPGEVLETVPGLIITQHSGGGKANQYYLRGFTLDHGTDFAFYVDGVPINLPSHAHGQGYADLNWLIPELIQGVTYEKGVYYADQGNFADAGAAQIKTFDLLPRNFLEETIGGFGYARTAAGYTQALGEGHVTFALESMREDGPWDVPMNYSRFNGYAKYSVGSDTRGWSVGGQAYYGQWLGNDQVPQRAIDGGLIDRFGSLDPSTGGNTHRYALFGEWHEQSDAGATHFNTYLVQYNLNLYSNFTYFLNQTNGDQIQQNDNRVYAGAALDHSFYGKILGADMQNTFGIGERTDWITTDLNNTTARIAWEHNRLDQMAVTDLDVWWENKIRWLSWFRTTLGLRQDTFFLRDNSDNPLNSGARTSGYGGPKLSLIFGPWAKTEFYAQAGYGFRTNDARGVLSTVAPITATDGSVTAGQTVNQLPAISGSRGGEVGVRSQAISGWNTTLALWGLWTDSDVFFDGDVGATTDTNRPGVRYGVEWSNFYTPVRWLQIDADFAYSRALFRDGDPLGQGLFIPEAVTSVIEAGITVRGVPGTPEDLFASLRLRQFGPRPLTTDGSQYSSASSVANFELGYDLSKNWSAEIELLNILDTAYNDAEYYYSSRLKGEAAGPDDGGGYNDHMVHSGEPRSLRVTLAGHF